MGDDATRSALAAVPVWGAPIARPIWLASCPFPFAPRAAYSGDAPGLFATDGTVHTNITPTAGFGGVQEQANFTGGMFNGLAVFNDATKVPAYWAGSLASVALPLPLWPAADRAGAMRPFKYFLVQAGGIIDGADAPYGVRWSVSAAPGSPPATWLPASTNDAGYVTLAGAREPLLDMAPLRDGMLIFEPHATWILSYIGGAFTFGNRRVLHTAGLLARNAWGALGTEIVFVADGDVLISEGTTVKSLLSRRMRTAMFGQLNVAARSKVFMSVSVALRQVVIAFPSGSSTFCDKALIWDYADDNIGLIDLPLYSFAVSTYAMSLGGLG
jgi:hypothetical protein